MKTTVEKITPEQARKYLLANTDNYRKLSRGKVAQYAGDMKAGRWQLNGQGIAFGKDGILKDGQHRLAAIVQAGVPVEIAVNRDIENDVTLFDIGLNRTVKQIVSASGTDIPKVVGSAANALVGAFSPAPKGMVVKYIAEHMEELERAYRVSCLQGNGSRVLMSTVLAAYLTLRTDRMPVYEMEVFFRVFGKRNTFGSDGYEPSGALVAARMFDDRKGKTSQAQQREQLEILLLAMKDFHEGKARQISYRLSAPFLWEGIMSKVRKEDGLE